ncbi:MAG: hypothetical protein H3C48_16710 [Chitinophagaceae bacterium]|nr:hypothetical protein [Chitinophagaceae bacterium]
MTKYPVWTIVCFLTILWYIIVTLIVSFKGGADIKNLLKDLQKDWREEEGR